MSTNAVALGCNQPYHNNIKAGVDNRFEDEKDR